MLDLEAARKAGYGDDVIARALAEEQGVDFDAALKAGYSPSDMLPSLMDGAQEKGFFAKAGDFISGALADEPSIADQAEAYSAKSQERAGKLAPLSEAGYNKIASGAVESPQDGGVVARATESTDEGKQAELSAVDDVFARAQAEKKAEQDSFREFNRENPNVAAFGSGTRSLASSIADIPQLSNDLIKQVAIDPFRHLFGKESLPPTARFQIAKDFEQAGKDYMPEIAKKSLSELKGYKDVGSWIAAQAAMQSPQIVASTGAALIPKLRAAYLSIMGLSSGASNYQENLEKGVNQSTAMKGALTNAAFEVIGESLPFGVFDSVGKYIRKLPPPQRGALIADALKKTMLVVGAGVAQQASEGIGEGVTQIGQNASERYVIGDKSVGLMDRVPEAVAIGAIMGTPTAVAQSYRTALNPSDILDKSKTISESIDTAASILDESLDVRSAGLMSAEPVQTQPIPPQDTTLTPVNTIGEVQNGPTITPAAGTLDTGSLAGERDNLDRIDATELLGDDVLSPAGQGSTGSGDTGDILGSTGQNQPVSDGGDATVAFADPHEERVSRHFEKADKAGISREHAEIMAPEQDLDHVTGFYRGEEKGPTLKRAQEYVEKTGEAAHYVDADIANLGGINAHFENNADVANQFYRGMANIFREEMEKAGSRAVMIRQGGDEISAVVIGGNSKSVAKAMAAVHKRTQEYAAENGLGEIPYGKRKDDKTPYGTGIYMGAAEIKSGEPLDDAFKKASATLNRSKEKGLKNVTYSEGNALGLGAPDRQARGIEPGNREDRAGSGSEGGAGSSGMGQKQPGMAAQEGSIPQGVGEKTSAAVIPVSKKRSKKANTLLTAVRDMGGLSLNTKRDVAGEKMAPGGYNQLFRSDAKNTLEGLAGKGELDEFLPYELRFATNDKAGSEVADMQDAVEWIKDRIRSGERIIPYDAQMELDQREIEAQALIDAVEEELSYDEINAQLQLATDAEREDATNARIFNAGNEESGAGSSAGTEAGKGTGTETDTQEQAFQLKGETNAEIAAKEARAQDASIEDKAAADRAAEVPFTLSAQSQEKPAGAQAGMFTPDGRATVAAEAKQSERVVDVFGNGSKIQYFDDRRGTYIESQKYPSGNIKWRAGEVVDGIGYWLSDKEYPTKEQAEASIRSQRALNTRKANYNAKYGAIPNTWNGESLNAAKIIIDAGVHIDRFSSSTQTISKYLYTENGVKVRLADHALPINYDGADVDYRYGGDIQELANEVIDAEKKAATANSLELGSKAPDKTGMQERPAVRADKSGSLTEPAQPDVAVGGKSNIPQQDEQGKPEAKPVFAYPAEQAALSAEKRQRAQGFDEGKVVPHPTEAGKFAVVPMDSEVPTAKAKKLEVLKAQAQGSITGDQGAALKELADAGEHAAVDAVLKPAPEPKARKESKIERERRQSLEDHFAIGNIIKSSYWRETDKVLDFKWNDGNWRVTVQQVEKNDDGEWVAAGRERTHATNPDAKDVIVDRVAPAKPAEEAQAEQPASAEAAPAIKTKETDKGTALFSRAQSYPELAAALEKYEGTGELATVQDLANEVDALIGEDLAPESLQAAIETYRDELAYSDSLKGRGDMDAADEAFIDAIRGVINSDVMQSLAGKVPGQTAASVKQATQSLRNRWLGFRNVKIVQSVDEVPNEIYLRALRALKPINHTSEGFFDPKTNSVYLIADNLASPERAVWVAIHEVVGHGGIRMLDRKLADTLDIAGKNSTVQKLSKAIAVDRGEKYNATEHIDEAIAELSAAHVTGQFDTLLKRYGVEVPTAMRGNLQSVIKQIVDALRAFVARVMGKKQAAEEVSDKDILNIIKQMQRAVTGEEQLVEDSGMVMASASGKRNQTDTPEFKKWFGESKAVDADGNPLALYRGTVLDENVLPPRTGAAIFASQDQEFANEFSMRGMGNNQDDYNSAMEDEGLTPNVAKIYIRAERPFDFSSASDRGRLVKRVFSRTSTDQLESGEEALVLDGELTVITIDVLNESLIDPEENWTIIEHPEIISAIKSLGYDSYKVREKGIENWAVFGSNQIKSATGNIGTFDSSNPDIRFSSGKLDLQGGETSKAESFKSPSETMLDNVIYKLQDKNIDLKRVIEEIKATGKVLADKYNTYLQEELFHGRAAKRTQDFVNTEMKPLLEDMRMRGLTIEQLDEYLHARHAKEANALIAERDPNMPDGGSGMTDAQADAYMDGLSDSAKTRLAAVAKRVDSILAKTRGLYSSYGLVSKNETDAWGEMFQHYVPLMREDHDGGMGVGQGFSVKGKEVKHRTGSTAKVVDILANIALQREKAITRGEKNRVAVSLAGLVKLNPNPDFWTFGKVPTERVLNETTGLVEERIDPMFKSRPNAIIAKISDGKGNVVERAVIFNESNDRAMRMAESLKNLDAAQMAGLWGVMAHVTRYFASVNTQYNPVFGITNIVRDVQGMALNLDNTALAKHKLDVIKAIPAMLKGIYQDARMERKGRANDSETSKLWEELQDEGGMTGYRDLYRNSEDRANAIKHELDPHNWVNNKWGKVFTAGGMLKVPLTKAQDVAGPIFNWLSDYNQTLEGATRLATYKVALDNGFSKQQAASLAKNITVNFNRKGQIGQQAGALYAFFNAAMQGTARIGQTIFAMDKGDIKTLRLNKTGKTIVYGGVLLGVMQAVALAAAGFDDDEPPEFVRERSLIFPIGNKKYVSLPMPLGYHVLPNIGRITTEFAMNGFKKPTAHVIKLAGIFAEAFNPIGSAGLSFQTIAFTPFDPLAALAENKDWTGKHIAKPRFDTVTPGFSHNKDTATTLSKLIAEAFNTLTGGDKYTAGAFSPTADQLDYLAGQVGGGVWREGAKLEQAVASMVTGEELPAYKIPLVGRFYGDGDSKAGQGGAYYSNLQRVKEVEAGLKGRLEDDLPVDQFKRDNPEYRLIGRAKLAESTLRSLQKRKREMIEHSVPREKIRLVEERITQVMKQFNESASKLEAP